MFYYLGSFFTGPEHRMECCIPIGRQGPHSESCHVYVLTEKQLKQVFHRYCDLGLSERFKPQTQCTSVKFWICLGLMHCVCTVCSQPILLCHFSPILWHAGNTLSSWVLPVGQSPREEHPQGKTSDQSWVCIPIEWVRERKKWTSYHFHQSTVHLQGQEDRLEESQCFSNANWGHSSNAQEAWGSY